MEKRELPIERQLVLMGSVEVDSAGADDFIHLLEGRLDWSEILFQLITHRTLNMFYYNVRKSGLEGKLENEARRLMETQWQVYGQRNRCYLSELAGILEEFAKSGLVVPVIKGNLLAGTVYPEIETRIFNDLDLLIKIEDAVPVTRALENAGFIQGHYDSEKNVIVEASRKEKMLQQIASHELQEFQKLGGDPFARLIQVDVNHDVLWKGNCPYRIPTAEMISRAVPVSINGVKGCSLDHIDNLIQLSCHLYKEATLMMWVTDLRDLKIYKFADIFTYIRKYSGEIDWHALVERVRGYGIEKVIYYNLHYIGLMFEEIVPQFVMAGLKPQDLTYLDEYGIENKEPSIWEYDFFTRLFETDRVMKLTQDQYRNLSRFLDAKVRSDGHAAHRIIQNQGL